MQRGKYYLILTIAVVIIGGITLWFFGRPQKVVAPTGGIIYYYGKDCPHCQEVEKFMEDNKVAEKVEFAKEEVQYSNKNAQELLSRGRECNLEKEEIGSIPLVYDKGQCFLGAPEVIDFFKSQIDKYQE